MNNINGKEILEYEDELLAALEEARQVSSDGKSDEPFTVTRPEAQKIFGLSRRKTVAILDRMCESNILKRQKIGRVNNWDDLNHIAGYKLIKVKQ